VALPGAVSFRRVAGLCYVQAVATDLELLDRWCSGDNDAGNQLVLRYFDSLYRFFDNKVGKDSDELIQATFLACTKSRDKFRRQSSFRTYLFTIARHELYDYLRQLQRHRGDLDADEVSILDLGTSPTGKMGRNQEHKLLLLALRSLPIEQQVLLELHYWEDLDAPELAEIFGVAVTAMRMRLTRARQALHQRMESMEESPLLLQTGLDDLEAWARSIRERGPHGPDESDE
jgi:RNA polymerase sigma factor (sigma-70 family)